ncbi:hypothetical protein J6590_042745 [Homalodisca vitripennis]|nr:hypothetical protein J6590_042745 [Homalodisca vitripennis]
MNIQVIPETTRITGLHPGVAIKEFIFTNGVVRRFQSARRREVPQSGDSVNIHLIHAVHSGLGHLKVYRVEEEFGDKEDAQKLNTYNTKRKAVVGQLTQLYTRMSAHII